MKIRSFDVVQVGESWEEVIEGPISRHTLGLYAHASGDCNPLHLDSDYARHAGMPDVFAHGMLSMAYLARVLTNWVDQRAMRQMSVRFMAITQLGDVIYCNARVVDKFIRDGEKCVALELTTRNQLGQSKLNGQAVVALA